jgi:hypothetical protein
MNRSSGKADAANASVGRRRLRQLLHAFADAGQPSATGPQLLVGPNGVLVWTEAPQVDRSEPYAGAVLAVPGKSTAPVDRQSPVAIRPEEPAETPVHAQLKAAVSR